MKLKNTLALSLAAVMAAGLTACGSSADTASAASPAADSTAAESTEAAADTTAAPDGDGDPTTLTVAMSAPTPPTTGPRTMMPTALWRSAAPATTPTATTS